MNLEKRQRLTREPAALKDHKENTQDANIASKLHTPAPKGDLVRVNNWLVSPLNPSKCLRVVISNEVHLHSPEIEYHREILEHIRARAVPLAIFRIRRQESSTRSSTRTGQSPCSSTGRRL